MYGVGRILVILVIAPFFLAAGSGVELRVTPKTAFDASSASLA